VTSHRILSIAAAVGLAVLASPRAGAASFTAQEDALLEIAAARAPLALSGDGAWRLHVDAHDVLHRASLGDPTRETTVQLPRGVQVLSTSDDGLKVALATNRQCVGLVDFGSPAGATAKVSWRPWILNGDGAPLGPDSGGWVAQMPADCGDHGFAPPVAISSDGRWIATADAVVEAATNRVVASLPAGHARVLRLQFVDHDARLLVAAATLGQHAQSASDVSGLDFSVWDLASKTLVNHVEVADVPLATAASLQVGFSAQTGALFHVDEQRRDRAQRAATPGETPVPLPLDLVQLAPGACGTAPRTRAQVGDDLGASFIVDPYGRWFASSRPLVATRDAAELAAGARSVLVVQDMASGRQLDRVTSRYALNGLVATPDGATLFALASRPVEPETGDTIAGWPAVPDGEQLVELTLPDAATTATRDVAKAWERGFCKENGEAPGARALARSEHLLKPLWSRDLSADPSVTRNAQAVAPEIRKCDAGATGPSLFKSADGGLWLDLSARIAKLDPSTGASIADWPTPRTKTVCSVVTPSGNGFLNAGGDTLTWRPLLAATEPGRRRIVDRRPGWIATLTPGRQDVVRVVWSPVDGSHDLVAADYDANGKRVREFGMSAVEMADAAQGEVDESSQPAPCHDSRGTPLAIGFDWRAGPFGSQRGVTCGPLPGVARLVWWSGATIAPRADRSDTAPRAQPSIDGAIAIAADDTQLHVVNLALQREIAQIDLGDGFDGRTWVLAAKRLALVEATGSDGHRWLRAYALP
jgi:hypothetical protein